MTGGAGYADLLRTVLPGFHRYADDLRKFVTGDSGYADHLRSLLPGFDGYADDLRKFVTGESGYADHLRTLLPGFHGYADDLRKFVTDGYILLYKGVTVFRWVVLGRRALGFYRGVGGVGLLHTAVTAPR